MKTRIDQILAKEKLNRLDIITLLSVKDTQESEKIFKKAYEIKKEYIGNKVYLRGLIEYTNKCEKNCLYCGIRAANKSVDRYVMDEKTVLDGARYAIENDYGSVVIQSGEICNDSYTDKIAELIYKIKQMGGQGLGITLSLGEQKPEVYQKWKDAGANRYLLRIESSNEELYYKIHPQNDKHNYQKRLEALQSLKDLGYQTGTGVMIGLPFQTIEDLANDLIFMKKFDIDMVGMGPYLEHDQTPLSKYDHLLLPQSQRFHLSLLMIAILRIMMKDINIAASTALQAIATNGREHGLMAGANIIMPNVSDLNYKPKYQLYNNKPGITENSDSFIENLKNKLNILGEEIGWGVAGNSRHFQSRQK